jgi:hypothetical protein
MATYKDRSTIQMRTINKLSPSRKRTRPDEYMNSPTLRWVAAVRLPFYASPVPLFFFSQGPRTLLIMHDRKAALKSGAGCCFYGDNVLYKR